MKLFARLALALVAAAPGGCIYGVQQENPAVVSSRPPDPPSGIAAYRPPQQDYPSIGGDILHGTSPADLAAAREAAVRPLTPDPGR
jgi:hypothetical protein